MPILILGLLIFFGIHSIRILAPQWRERQRAAMGEGQWKGAYTLVSLVGLVLIIWGFGMARQTTGMLYNPPAGLRHLALLLMLFAFLAMAVSVVPAGRLKPILKHPMLLSVKIWAVAHLLANGETSSVLLFGTFLIWAVLDRISVKRRRAPIPAPGPVKWDVIAIAGGSIIYLLVLFRLHEWLIGVAPIT